MHQDGKENQIESKKRHKKNSRFLIGVTRLIYHAESKKSSLIYERFNKLKQRLFQKKAVFYKKIYGKYNISFAKSGKECKLPEG